MGPTVAMPMLVTTMPTQLVLSTLPSVPPMPSQQLTLMPMPMLTTMVLDTLDIDFMDMVLDTPDMVDMVLDTLDIILASVAPMPSQRPMLMLTMDTMVMDMATVDTMVMDMVMDMDMLVMVMDMAMDMDTMVMASKSRSNITTRKQLP